MVDKIGASFVSEIEAAGLLGLPFGWNDAGEISGHDNLSLPDQAKLDAVLAAHNPSTPAPPPNLGLLVDARIADDLVFAALMRQVALARAVPEAQVIVELKTNLRG